MAPKVLIADPQQPLVLGVTATPVVRALVHVKAVNGWHAAELEAWSPTAVSFKQGEDIIDVEVCTENGRAFIFPKMLVYWVKEEITSETYFRAANIGPFYEWDKTAGVARLRQG